MNPTDQQLQNRLNPTPVNLNLPVDGQVFIDPNDPLRSQIYVRSGNTVYATSFQNLGMQYLRSLGVSAETAGGGLVSNTPGDAAKLQAAGISFGQSINGNTINTLGRSYFQNQTGIDPNSIGAGYNIADVRSAYGIQDAGANYSLFKPNSPSGSQTQTINNTPNQLAPGVAPGVQPALTGAAATAATGAVAAPNNGQQTDIYATNPLYLRPNETIDQYNARIAASNPDLPAPGTTSSTGVTNTATSGSTQLTGSSTAPTATTSSNPATISSDILKTTPANFTSPNYGNLYALTPSEQDAQNKINALLGLNTQEAGKADYQNQLQQSMGLTDTQNRLTALKNEQNAIPLQIEQNFQGRGVTKAGIQPIQTGALRNNAIQTLATATQLDQLNNAVQQQVNAKYAPIEAQIQAAKDNLQLIINSPQYSQDDKKRAQQQLDFQNQKDAAIAQQKTDDQNKYAIYLTAAQNGADPATLLQIKNALTSYDAASIAGQYAQKASTPKIIGSATSGYYQVDSNGSITPLITGTGTSPGNPTGNSPISSGTLSFSEVQQYGLPTSMVGYNEGQLARDLQSYFPPQWFIDYQHSKGIIDGSQITQAWSTFQTHFGQKSTTSTGIVNPY